ncbi:MAG: CCA tRNA nucleotidyltransferase, partial [Lactobacillus crispatus]|nr:CCA tRNA nucleotidyltransferase [Lactobacillus crispatus]
LHRTLRRQRQMCIRDRFLIDRGMRPGAKLGQTLNKIRELVVSGEVENNQEAIESYLTTIE